MIRHRPSTLFLSMITALMLACSIPTEVLDAINRLPTPTSSPTPTPSSRLYVEKTGNDTNDCLTPGTACLTIKAALGRAADGAAVYIGPGTYADNDGRGDWILTIDNQNVSLYGAATPGGLTTILSGGGIEDAVTIAGNSRVVLENVAIVDAGGRGYGLYVTGGTGQQVTLRNVEIRNHLRAGVVIRSGATVVLEHVLITNNPGAISNSGDLTLRFSRVMNNGSVIPRSGLGTGVIYNDGTLRLSDSTVAGNTPTDTHVIHNTGGGTMTVERSTFSDHEIGRNAALYNSMDSTMSLINSTVSDNSGSGIVSLGDLSLTFTTISGNGLNGLSGNSGESDPMTLRLANVVIENNGEQDCYFQLGHSIVFDRRGRNLTDGSCDFEYGGSFPRPPEGDFFLGPLADNGGPTRTRALLEYNRGIDTAEGPCPATDQRGVARPVGGGCDVGAYEFTFALTAATPAETPIPIETPEPEDTQAGESRPMVILLENANCRKGPATGYDTVITLSKGLQAPATGRDEASTWWRIQVPDTSHNCWVFGSLIEPPDDPSQVPTASVNPVPATPGGFHAVKTTCSANLQDFPVDLGWTDAGIETGYRLYRNGELLATLGENSVSYSDSAPKATALMYELEAFNALGKSGRVSLGVPACQ